MDFISILFFFVQFFLRQVSCESPRQFLLFPKTAPTRIQFIGGIGIPAEDLAYEAVTSGYVLKAEYFLPTRAEEVSTLYLNTVNIKERRSVNDYMHPSQTNATVPKFASKQLNKFSTRYLLYDAIKIAFESQGFAGTECLLRTICEYAKLPLHEDIGLEAELVNILLRPSLSNENYDYEKQRPYLRAEKYGSKGGNCETFYKRCPILPLEQYTSIFEQNGT